MIKIEAPFPFAHGFEYLRPYQFSNHRCETSLGSHLLHGPRLKLDHESNQIHQCPSLQGPIAGAGHPPRNMDQPLTKGPTRPEGSHAGLASHRSDRSSPNPRARQVAIQKFTQPRSACLVVSASNPTTATAAGEMEAAAAGGGGGRWCVVTGGRGFAARHLVTMLLRSGEWRVRVADLAPAIALDRDEEEGFLGAALREGQAAYVSADLRDKAQVAKAFEGAEVVFHMAAPDSSINNFHLHYSVNVEGTKNVIDACISCKVKRLIYTSSPSVVFDGVHGIFNGDESMPYPDKFNDSYSETKADGEKLVMRANGREGLLTCCIRPSSIFGPGDKLLVPSLVAAAKAGKSKYIIGDGNNYYDFTYVENVAYGHVCAEKTLSSEDGAKIAAGKTYFITNMEPIKFWEFMSLILEGLGYERPSIKIPVSVMMPVAHVVEWTYKKFAKYGMKVPQLTPSRIRLLSCNRTFSCSRAKDQLGYEPLVPLKEGLKRTVESYPHLRAQNQRSISKASVFLGNGNLAKTLLWEDTKQTVTVLLLLAVIYYHLFTCGYTFITAMAKLLSLTALFLFIHGMLPANVFGHKVEKLEASNFHITQVEAHHVAHSISSSWNSAVGALRSLCRGNDWPLFLKVALSLLVVSILSSMSSQAAFKIGTALVFTGFKAYEKWEDTIDSMVSDACSILLHIGSTKKSSSQKQM
ncbi:3beta-hydroxysteroid-dehydrogenase/decarboxylase isoform 1-like [Panicum miliaceum]|uniref:Reticulon-like protein n=1 Tax=Panicum miliaceum TaxID=4540 RepID=A0A3L6TLJ2_PANMI|nr:3beta-hydroxysteroid-dehydrogenase/decarboxylase isoform 1-like [Panicum miliaceum]